MSDVYVTVGHGVVHTTLPLTDTVMVDYDSTGRVLGIEVLGALDATVDDRTPEEKRTMDDNLVLGRQILDLPMKDNDAGASTVRGYLCALLAVLWDEQECFGGKRPFGNSGWHHELHEPLVTAGLLAGELETDEDEEPGIDYSEGNRLIRLAIEALADYTQAEDEASRVVIARG